MENSFLEYLQKLEIMAFFTGYPLLFATVYFVSEKLWSKNKIVKRMMLLLPYGYALTGTLYLGLQLKNLSPDYAFEV